MTRIFQVALPTSALLCISVLSACGGTRGTGDGGIAFPDGSHVGDGGIPTGDGAVTPDGSHADGGHPGTDGGPPPGRDAGPPVDLGPEPDFGVTCSSDWDCEDFDGCTTDRCVGSTCSNTPVATCGGCRTDAECDDRDPSTYDTCDTWHNVCSHLSGSPFCSVASDCDDGNPCTEDECPSGSCAWGSVPDCCVYDSSCDDGDDCTTDTCGASHTCSHGTVAGCMPPPPPGCDFDHDGYGSSSCFPFGGDCNDFDPMIHPGATENCTDGVDNDCDGARDGVDTSCASPNTTCGGAIAVTDGSHVTGNVISMGGATGPSCGASLFYTLTLAATSDVEVDLTVEMPMDPTTPTCPGCPPPTPVMHELNYNVFLEGTCGDTTTDLGHAGGGCYYWSPGGGFFTGSASRNVVDRRVPPGTYTIEIEAKDMFAWMTTSIPFHFDVHVTPSAAPSCTAVPALVDGATVSGTTTGATDAFGLDCSSSAVAAPEALYTFTLADRRRVRLHASSRTSVAGGYVQAPRLELFGTCDPDATRLRCVDGGSLCSEMGGTTDSLDRTLDAGTYTVVLEATSAGTLDYDLSYATEAEGAACAAPYGTITASGSLMGTTDGATDEFRYNRTCGNDAAPDRVYAMTLDAPRRVVLDLVASYTGAKVIVYSDCGDTQVAGGDTTHVDSPMLAAGTYYVVVDGAHATGFGTFVLNATIL